MLNSTRLNEKQEIEMRHPTKIVV